MAKLAPYVFWQELDDNGDPLAGGLVYTYEADTSTPKATYTDSGGGTANANPVVLDASGRASIWLGDGAYKFVIKDSSDNTIDTRDNITGDTSSGLGTTVVAASSGISISTTNDSNLIVCTSALTVALPAAATAGDGFRLVVKNESTGNVTIDPSGSETIDGTATYTLKDGCTVFIQCDGSTWTSFAYSSTDEVGITQVSSSQDTTSAVQNEAAGTWTDVTGSSVSITPAATTNKVKITAHLTVEMSGGGGIVDLQILRGSTAIFNTEVNIGSAGNQIPVTMVAIDAPSATTSTTYKVQFRQGSTNTARAVAATSHNRTYVLEEIKV